MMMMTTIAANFSVTITVVKHFDLHQTDKSFAICLAEARNLTYAVQCQGFCFSHFYLLGSFNFTPHPLQILFKNISDV